MYSAVLISLMSLPPSPLGAWATSAPLTVVVAMKSAQSALMLSVSLSAPSIAPSLTVTFSRSETLRTVSMRLGSTPADLSSFRYRLRFSAAAFSPSTLALSASSSFL